METVAGFMPSDRTVDSHPGVRSGLWPENLDDVSDVPGDRSRDIEESTDEEHDGGEGNSRGIVRDGLRKRGSRD